MDSGSVSFRGRQMTPEVTVSYSLSSELGKQKVIENGKTDGSLVWRLLFLEGHGSVNMSRQSWRFASARRNELWAVT